MSMLHGMTLKEKEIAKRRTIKQKQAYWTLDTTWGDEGRGTRGQCMKNALIRTS
jgi:hypothetical protein